MSETVHDRVNALLETATSKAEGAPTADDDESTTDPVSDEDLREAAADAADLFEDDSRTVLEALSLADSADGEGSRTIPEAIVSGEPERVADLRTLIALAKLSEPFEEGDDDAIEERFETLRSTVEERSIDESEGSEAETTDEGAEVESAEATDEELEDGEACDEESEDGEEEGDGIAETAASAVSDALQDEGETGEGAEESGDEELDIEDRLREAMTSSIGDFGDEIQKAKAHLERIQSDGAAAGEEESGAAAEDETDVEEETDAEDEDSLFGFGDESDEGVGDGGGGSGRNWTMHSTMAPPPSKRADMRAVARHSTMPRRRD